MNGRPRYNVKIAGVRDITLRGTADYAFWQRRLEREQLLPAPDGDGKAQLMVIAVDAKFMGLRFLETSVAVFVRAPGGEEPIGVFLPYAFNSRRAFAWVERTFYNTPYYPARIHVETRVPAGIEVSLAEGAILSIAMASDSTPETRKPIRSDQEVWEGPILLPRAAGDQQGKLFFARLEGRADAYAFSARDTIMLVPTARAPIVEWLGESEFSPLEWSIRASARHARSKSVSRTSVELTPAGLAG